MKALYYFLICTLLFSGTMSCNSDNQQVSESLAFNEPPAWSRNAIWYQLFVERFRNGDKSNDPTLATIHNAVDDQVPSNWSVTEWGHNWYAQEDWAKETDLDFYRTVQMRRVGGDLQGVHDKLDYLVDLGITAIYFNPINDAPSLHKFDARNYRHVDITFGPDPKGDIEIMKSEVPDDPSTWKMTSADKLFFDLVKRCHEKGIRVVVDFSWNHTGRNFWAFKDIVEHQENSKYKDWFEITHFDDPMTTEDEFEYEGWFGIKNLPDLKKRRDSKKIHGLPYEGDLFPEPKQHVFNVAKKYMDPNGDGDPSDGIDGMRLDVAEHVPLGFWRDFRKHVRSINPEFYLVGECWWTTWPDTLMDPAPWVKGDIFDAVMHYQWYKPTRGQLLQSEDSLSLEEWKYFVDSIFRKYPVYTQEAMMNLGSSHDSPRLATSMANKNKYKHNAHPGGNENYNIAIPAEDDYMMMQLLMTQQFTWKGSPHIWMGDELGMTGNDDPDNRKPLWWDDIDFENETPSFLSALDYNQPIKANKKILSTYKELIKLRKANPVLAHGDFRFEDGIAETMNYLRYDDGGNKIRVIINPTDEPTSIKSEGEAIFQLGTLSIHELGPRSAVVYKLK